MSSNTKDRLLNDLEALRQQLAQIEAYGTDDESGSASIPTLEVDNIPLLGDAVPADREEAILAHREAMAQLDAELKELDKKEKTHLDEDGTVKAPTTDRAAIVEPSTTDTTTEAEPKTANESAPTNAEQASAEESLSASVDALAKITQAKPAYADADLSLEDTGPREAITDLPPSFSNPTAVNQTPAPQLTPTAAIPAMTLPNTASDENPFLPQHLRERLDKSKTSLLQEIARSSESLDASTAMLRNFGGADYVKNLAPVTPTSTDPSDHQALVDTLVAKYLPLIEADLRQRLNTALQHQLAVASKNKKAVEPSL